MRYSERRAAVCSTFDMTSMLPRLACAVSSAATHLTSLHLSAWIRELRQISGRRNDGRHFILSFHDITLECVSRDFTVYMHEGHSAELMGSATNRSRRSLQPTAGRRDAQI